jgi:hypothetical protein
MPCYGPSWDDQLQAGTPAFEMAKSKVDACKRSTFHIIDYYLDLCGLPVPLPAAESSEMLAEWRSLVEETTRAPPLDVGTPSIDQYRSALFLIANHLRCDGVSFQHLWDQQSLIVLTDPRELGYGWIIRWCVYMLTGSFKREGWSIRLTHDARL